MIFVLNRLLTVIPIIALSSFGFGNITRDSFFTSPNGIPTHGSFFSGFLYPFTYNHPKTNQVENIVAGVIMQFTDKANKDPNNQTNTWFLRIPSIDSTVHELQGKFNFDITPISDSKMNKLTIKTKVVQHTKSNGKEIFNHLDTLEKIPLVKNIFTDSSDVKIKSISYIDIDDNLFSKHIIFINQSKIDQYINETGIDINKIKQALLNTKETRATAEHLPDDPNEYIVGIIGAPEEDTPKSNPPSFRNTYFIKSVDFVYLKYNPGVDAFHERY